MAENGIEIECSPYGMICISGGLSVAFMASENVKAQLRQIVREWDQADECAAWEAKQEAERQESPGDKLYVCKMCQDAPARNWAQSKVHEYLEHQGYPSSMPVVML